MVTDIARQPRGQLTATGRAGVGDPVGPGADVEGGGKAGQREGEDLVGRGDAGAAVGADRGTSPGMRRPRAANRAARLRRGP